MIKELQAKAKELGIKSVHLYKDEEKLKAKIAEIEKPQEDVGKEVEYESVKNLRKWKVMSGKFYHKGHVYRSWEEDNCIFESNEDYSGAFEIKEV
jgi:hypothetical protein